jgi:uncharacterized protein (UPF0332 family)
MGLENITIYNEKLKWCLAKKTRMKKINQNTLLSKEHLNKAKHNLKAANYNIIGGFSDWAISQLYYSMYHSLLSILFKVGFESKNHDCTINTILYLIENKIINLDLKDIAFIRTTGEMKIKDAKSLREEFQYGTKTIANEKIINYLIINTKKFLEKVEITLNELDN